MKISYAVQRVYEGIWIDYRTVASEQEAINLAEKLGPEYRAVKRTIKEEEL